MGKAQNRKLQKQYQKEQLTAKRQKGTPASKPPEEHGILYKIVKLLLLSLLPLLFLIFGLIMFPITNGGNNNQTLSESFTKTSERSASEEGYCVGHDCPPEKGASEKRTKRESTSEKSTKKESNLDSDVPPEIRDFKATILDHLAIQDIVLDGKKVKAVELTSEQGRKGAATRLYQFDGFLSDRECEGLKRAHQRHISESSQHDAIICFDSIETLRKHLKDALKNIQVSRKDFTEGTTCVNTSFSSQLKSLLHWSHSTSFYPGESKFSNSFEDRIYQATGMLPCNGGKFQVTSYPEGIGYKTHTDCIVGHHDNRDRFATILVYLQDVEKGGETQFPELGISVTPKKGRAIVWNNMNSAGQCEPLSVHTAAQVKEGHKFIIQRWYYYKSFFQLGKRYKEPSLPPRSPGQPKVSCDEYEHGSCRWYDEWGYDHLTDYAKQKHSLKN